MMDDSNASWFVKLPTSVGRHLLSKWLDIRSLGLLDSACCTRVDRLRFLEMLHYIEAMRIYTSTRGPYSLSTLHWVIARQITCTSFVFCPKETSTRLFADALRTFLSITALSLKRVHMYCDRENTEHLLECIEDARCCLNSLEINATSVLQQTDAPARQSHLRSVLINSAHTLTKFSFGRARNNTIAPSFAGLCLPVLLKIRVSVNDDEDILHMCQAAPNLLDVHIARMDCSHSGLATIGQYCHELKCLEIEQNEVEHFDMGISALSEGCPKLKQIQLLSCRYLTNNGLTSVGANCCLLEELVISYNDNITDASLEALAGTAARLTTLSIGDCAHVTGSGLVAIAKHCTLLRSLDISQMDGPIIEHMVNVIPLLGRLTALNMAYCDVDDEILRLVAEYMRRLEALDLFALDAPYYTAAGLTEVVMQCEHLRLLKIEFGFESIGKLGAVMRPKLKLEINRHW